MKKPIFIKFIGVALAVVITTAVIDKTSPTHEARATSNVLMLSENFDTLPGTPWMFGGATGTVNAGYPNVAVRNSSSRLRLTRNAGSEGGYALYDSSLPTTGGLDITFQFEMSEGGNEGADGISFLIVDGDTNQLQIGQLGGSLGYIGLAGSGGRGALLGIGFDRWGGFRTAAPNGGSAPGNCSTSFGFNLWADAITVRGPGASGYHVITSSNPCSSFFGDYRLSRTDSFTVRSNRERTARIVIDPSTVANPQVKVYLDDPHGDDVAGGNFTGTPGISDSSTPRVTFAQPTELRSATSFKFGFAAATGSRTNNHDILGISVRTLQPLPPVRWSTTASLPAATIGAAYTQTMNGADGLPAYTYSLISGSLPAGLSLTNGEITGTPTSCADSTFVLRLSDRQSPPSTSDQTFTMRVNDAQQSCVYITPTTTTIASATTTTPSPATVTTVQRTNNQLPRTGTSAIWTLFGVVVVAIGVTARRISRNQN